MTAAARCPFFPAFPSTHCVSSVGAERGGRDDGEENEVVLQTHGIRQPTGTYRRVSSNAPVFLWKPEKNGPSGPSVAPRYVGGSAFGAVMLAGEHILVRNEGEANDWLFLAFVKVKGHQYELLVHDETSGVTRRFPVQNLLGFADDTTEPEFALARSVLARHVSGSVSEGLLLWLLGDVLFPLFSLTSFDLSQRRYAAASNARNGTRA